MCLSWLLLYESGHAKCSIYGRWFLPRGIVTGFEITGSWIPPKLATTQGTLPRATIWVVFLAICSGVGSLIRLVGSQRSALVCLVGFMGQNEERYCHFLSALWTCSKLRLSHCFPYLLGTDELHCRSCEDLCRGDVQWAHHGCWFFGN